jgi:hypothetical protein
MAEWLPAKNKLCPVVSLLPVPLYKAETRATSGISPVTSHLETRREVNGKEELSTFYIRGKPNPMAEWLPAKNKL